MYLDKKKNGEGKRGKYLEKGNIFLSRVEGKGGKYLEKENILFPWTGRDVLTSKALLEVLADLLSICMYVGP